MKPTLNPFVALAWPVLMLAVPTPLPAAPTTSAPAHSSRDYQGRPFDDQRYRSEQIRQAAIPIQPYQAFAPALTIPINAAAANQGWVGPEERGATVQLGDADGRRVIHYHAKLSNYRYAHFGWSWSAPGASDVALASYDAVSFNIKVSGPKRPQELFFGFTETQPAPVSLREHDQDLFDGSWHRITIPFRSLHWNTPAGALSSSAGFILSTFVWDPTEFDVLLDGFSFDRSAKPSAEPDHDSKTIGSAAHGQTIPGRLECAFYDLGGEGVAYHDTTPINILSSVLNQQVRHQRSHSTRYEWDFRRDEAVDISFIKDWADLNHPNPADPPVNQLYIGGTEDGEWCNYTVEVQQAGTYQIVGAYGSVADVKPLRLSIDGQPASECTIPAITGSMHRWNKARFGTITFPTAGTHVLTLYYGRGYNLGYFDFVLDSGLANQKNHN